jgi:hypothetical protein
MYWLCFALTIPVGDWSYKGPSQACLPRFIRLRFDVHSHHNRTMAFFTRGLPSSSCAFPPSTDAVSSCVLKYRHSFPVSHDYGQYCFGANNGSLLWSEDCCVTQIDTVAAIPKRGGQEMLLMEYKIALMIGSLRRDSFNRRLGHALAKLSVPDFSFHEVRLDDLRLYNQDDENAPVKVVVRLKKEITAAHGIVFVTPEYNPSIPGVLQNAIDHASRPYGQSVWAGKPAGMFKGFGRCAWHFDSATASAQHPCILGCPDDGPARSVSSGTLGQADCRVGEQRRSPLDP